MAGRYAMDDSEVLISKATWTLKLSGLVFAGLLIVGRSASYGNITWSPAHHSAASPLVVEVAHRNAPAPSLPTLRGSDPAALSKPSAADERVAFSPGTSGDGEGGHSGDGGNSGGDHHDAQGSGHGSGNAASTVTETSASVNAQGSGHGSANAAN